MMMRNFILNFIKINFIKRFRILFVYHSNAFCCSIIIEYNQTTSNLLISLIDSACKNIGTVFVCTIHCEKILIILSLSFYCQKLILAILIFRRCSPRPKNTLITIVSANTSLSLQGIRPFCISSRERIALNTRLAEVIFNEKYCGKDEDINIFFHFIKYCYYFNDNGIYIFIEFLINSVYEL